MDDKELEILADLIANKIKQGGYDNMEHGNTRTSIDDFLTVRGFGGGYGYGGGGYGGGGYGGHGGILREDAHADGTGRGENIKNVKDSVHYGHDNINDRLEDIQRSGQFHQLFEQVANANMGAERRFGDLTKQICDSALEALKCCCENKEAIALTRSDLTGLIKDTTIENLKSDNSQNQTNSILVAINALAQAIASDGHKRG